MLVRTNVGLTNVGKYKCWLQQMLLEQMLVKTNVG